MEVLTHCHFGLMAVTAYSWFWLWKLPEHHVYELHSFVFAYQTVIVEELV